MDGWALLDRDRELSRLATAMDAAGRGRGSITVVEGEAGSGRSRLVEAARDLGSERGIGVRAAAASEADAMLPFGVARQLMCEARALPAGGAERRTRELLLARLEKAAIEAPLAVLVDDVQWCDPESLRLLAAAQPRLSARGCAFVVARRCDGVDAAAGVDKVVRAAGATMLRLRPLSQPAVAALASEALGGKVDPVFARACSATSGGSPFLLRELLTELAARAVEPSAANAKRVEEIGARAITWLVASRLAGVSDAARAFAEALAIAGDHEVAARLSGVSGPADAAHELVSAGLLVPEGRVFTQPMVRGAVIARLRPTEVAAGHRRAALILTESRAPAARVGAHLLHTDPAGDATVVETLRRAAAEATDPAAAATLLERALREPPPASERAPLRLALGAALTTAGDTSGTAYLEAALTELSDPDQRAEAALALGRAHSSSNRYTAAYEVLSHALAKNGGADLGRRRALEAETLYAAHFAGRSFGLGSDPANSHELPSLLIANIADDLSRHCTRRDDALALAYQALADRELPLVENSAGFVLALEVLYRSDLFADALHRIDRALPALRELGCLFNRQVAESERSRVLARMGRLEDAAAAESAVLADPSGNHAVRVCASGVLAGVLRLLARRDEAWLALGMAFEPAIVTDGDSIALASGYMARSALHRDAGRYRDVLADAERCGELQVVADGDTPAWNPWRSEAALALIGLGQRERALELAHEELHLARSWGAPRAIACALRTCAAAAPTAALELLREAESVISSCEAIVERAEVDLALGAALLLAGSARDARPVLRRGLEIAEACRAAALTSPLRATLVAAGGRPRRPASGPRSLTAAEREVTRLAALGATNAEIAERLVVSRTTVATHLHHAYRKLGIASRGQLADALAPAEA